MGKSAKLVIASIGTTPFAVTDIQTTAKIDALDSSSSLSYGYSESLDGLKSFEATLKKTVKAGSLVFGIVGSVVSQANLDSARASDWTGLAALITGTNPAEVVSSTLNINAEVIEREPDSGFRQIYVGAIKNDADLKLGYDPTVVPALTAGSLYPILIGPQTAGSITTPDWKAILRVNDLSFGCNTKGLVEVGAKGDIQGPVTVATGLATLVPTRGAAAAAFTMGFDDSTPFLDGNIFIVGATLSTAYRGAQELTVKVASTGTFTEYPT